VVTKEDYLRKAAEISAELEQTYKIRLFDEVIKPMVDAGLLHGPSGRDFWYSLKSFEEVYTMLGSRLGHDALFPIPTTCGTWFNTEIDVVTSKPFRFFNGYCWLMIKIPETSNFIKITLAHSIDSEILNKLFVKANDIDLPLYKRDIDDAGRSNLYFLLPAALIKTGEIKLELSTEVSGVPALIYQDNSDWRRLSAAVFYPEGVE
jgi:hypothetical protein